MKSLQSQRLTSGVLCSLAVGLISFLTWGTDTVISENWAVGDGTVRTRPVEIIGHRGASHDAPENTLASVVLAWEQQADAVEIDVFLTRDDQIVAIHDPTPKRFGGPDRKVSELTLAELRQIDVGSWKGERWAGERIPTLAEIVETIPDGKRLFIEVKCGAEIIPALSRVLEQTDKKPEQLALIGFSLETMTAVKQRFPAHETYWVVSVKRQGMIGKWKPTAEELVASAQNAGLDGVDIGKSPAVGPEYARKILDAGLQLYVWTVNSGRAAERFQALGFDGITTDRPGFLKQKLHREAAESMAP